MAGTTVRDEELGIETYHLGPDWHALARDLTTFLESGDKLMRSIEAIDLGAGCFVRFPSVHVPAKVEILNRTQRIDGEKTWIPDVHLEKTDDGWSHICGGACLAFPLDWACSKFRRGWQSEGHGC